MSGVPSTPLTPGRASARHEPVEQVDAVGHGQRPVAGAAARRGPGGRRRSIISLPCVAEQRGGAGAGAAAASAIALGPVGRGCAIEVAAAGRLMHGGLLAAAPRPRRSVGMASEQASRRGDDRAGGVGEPHRPLQVPAGEQAVAQRAAEGVAGAEAVDHLDRDRRHLDALVRRGPASTPLRALLDDGQLDAGGRAAPRAAACGSRSPTAASHSSRLPTATVTCAQRLAATQRAGLLAATARTSAGSRGRGR